VFDAIWLVVGNRYRLLPPHEESRLRLGLGKLIVQLRSFMSDTIHLRAVAIGRKRLDGRMQRVYYPIYQTL
jgi:hypothetical protein